MKGLRLKSFLLSSLLSIGVIYGFEKSNANIDYTSGIVKVKAMGCSESGVPDIVAEAEAYEAARVIALKNLAEAIKGVRIVGNVTVGNVQYKSGLIKTTVDTIIHGAVECPDVKPIFKYRESSQVGCVYNYCLMTKLFYGPNGAKILIPVIEELKKKGYPTKPPKAEEIASPEEAQEVVKKTEQQATLKEVDGVVIDVRELPNYTPSAAPIIVTKTMGGQYKPVFAPTMVDENVIRRKGAVAATVATKAQLDSVLQAWNIKHPLVIKAIGLTPEGAIVISNDDAIKLTVADQKNNFISKGNVIIWINPTTAMAY